MTEIATMSYDEFKRRYLELATRVASEHPDPRVPLRICRRSYEEMRSRDMCDVQAILLKFHELAYELMKLVEIRDTLPVVKQLFGKADAVDHMWIPFEQCLTLLQPVLGSLGFNERLTALSGCWDGLIRKLPMCTMSSFWFSQVDC